MVEVAIARRKAKWGMLRGFNGGLRGKSGLIDDGSVKRVEERWLREVSQRLFQSFFGS